MDKIDIRSLTLEELQQQIQALGFKKFRGKQVFNWIAKGVDDFKTMHNLPDDLIETLNQTFIINNAKIIDSLQSKDNTEKFLIQLHDGHIIESVLMHYRHGHSICISTQVGCRMGCSFCASTINGLQRNLTAGEMLGQIYAIQTTLGERIDNVVLMGSGEPLDNYEHVMKFLRLVNDDNGLNISHRNITLSTSGIVPKIYDLANEQLQITLAISLHAVDDDKRNELIPINQTYNIKQIIDACNYYTKKTKRRITFEYALINRVNDNITTAEKLSELLQGMLCHVNLIPINAVEEKSYRPSDEQRIKKFQKILIAHGINTTIRKELGSDINAACGQLRNNHIKTEIKKGFLEEK